MEEEQHLDVGEVFDAGERVRCESVRENDASLFSTPMIVVEVVSHRFDMTDRFHIHHHWSMARRLTVCA